MERFVRRKTSALQPLLLGECSQSHSHELDGYASQWVLGSDGTGRELVISMRSLCLVKLPPTALHYVAASVAK